VRAQQKKAFEKAFDVQHVKSAKEKQSGFDVAPILEGKLQFGKLHEKKTMNEKLLNNELCKRLERDLGRELSRGISEKRDMLVKIIDGGRQRAKKAFSDKDKSPAAKMGISAVKEALKYHEEEQCNRISAKYDERFFQVLHTGIDDYAYKLV
jgi:hypothetical protein